MFPRDVSDAFGREMGCTVADWLRSLPGAVQPHRLDLLPQGRAQVQLLDGGSLQLDWTELPPRVIALARFPRLQVEFRFEQVDAQRFVAMQATAVHAVERTRGAVEVAVVAQRFGGGCADVDLGWRAVRFREPEQFVQGAAAGIAELQPDRRRA